MELKERVEVTVSSTENEQNGDVNLKVNCHDSNMVAKQNSDDERDSSPKDHMLT